MAATRGGREIDQVSAATESVQLPARADFQTLPRPLTPTRLSYTSETGAEDLTTLIDGPRALEALPWSLLSWAWIPQHRAGL